MTTQTLIDNMTIDELAQFLKTGSTYDQIYIYAAKRMGNIYFTHKSSLNHLKVLYYRDL